MSLKEKLRNSLKYLPVSSLIHYWKDFKENSVMAKGCSGSRLEQMAAMNKDFMKLSAHTLYAAAPIIYIVGSLVKHFAEK